MSFRVFSPTPDGILKAQAFRARTPWFGPDLQTMRNFIVMETVGQGKSVPPSETVLIDCEDGTGDRLMAELSRPEVPAEAEKPLVIIIHGLTGCSGSSYVLRSAWHFLELGYTVVRLNLRGAGPSRSICSDFYHAGRFDDIERAVKGLEAHDASLFREGCVLIGYSLGGNITLNAVAEQGSQRGPVVAAAVVSTPIDLAMTSDTFRKPRNSVYQKWLLDRMKQEVLGGKLTAHERDAVTNARNVLEFDDLFIAPHFGFGNAASYYTSCSANRRLAEIRVPAIAIHAADDPWVPVEPYFSADWRRAASVEPVIVEGGGHVGFHESGYDVPWHDRKISDWLQTAVAPSRE